MSDSNPDELNRRPGSGIRRHLCYFFILVLVLLLVGCDTRFSPSILQRATSVPPTVTPIAAEITYSEGSLTGLLIPFKTIEITESGYARLARNGQFLGDIQLSDERMSLLRSQFDEVDFCNLQYFYPDDLQMPGEDDVDERRIYWPKGCNKSIEVRGDYNRQSLPEGLTLLIINLKRIMADIEQETYPRIDPH